VTNNAKTKKQPQSCPSHPAQKISQRMKISYYVFDKGRRLSARPTEGSAMFIPSEFAEQRDSVINAILAQYPLATLVTQSDQ